MSLQDRQSVQSEVARSGLAPEQQTTFPGSRPPAKPTLDYRVMIVQPDLALLRSIAESVRLAGLGWEGIADGELALQAFAQRPPHLLLLDAQLPGKSGIEVCHAIREKSPVPIILLLDQASSCEQVRCLRIGADDFVSKPVVPELLAARVLAHLRRVYQYNAPHETPSATSPRPTDSHAALDSTVTVPADWAACHACRYMGPRDRFPTRLAPPPQNMVLVCPHCGVGNEKSLV